jgi:cell division transport system permease protein
MQLATLTISTTLVLVLLGLVTLTVLTARNMSRYMKENLTVTLMLGDSVSSTQSHDLSLQLADKLYVRNVTYISKEQALKEQTEAMGSDPSEFLGVNPFVATLEIQLVADYANLDSLRWIAKTLKEDHRVTDVAYQEDLMDSVNRNLNRVSLALLVVAILLTFVSFSLINNSVRLGIFARRFQIHTMKLVGARWAFIRRPFIRRAFWMGMLSSLLACVVLGGMAHALWTYEPSATCVLSWQELGIGAAVVFAFGIVITTVCTRISVNHFLRMTAGELYKQ